MDRDNILGLAHGTIQQVDGLDRLPFSISEELKTP